MLACLSGQLHSNVSTFWRRAQTFPSSDTSFRGGHGVANASGSASGLWHRGVTEAANGPCSVLPWPPKLAWAHAAFTRKSIGTAPATSGEYAATVFYS